MTTNNTKKEPFDIRAAQTLDSFIIKTSAYPAVLRKVIGVVLILLGLLMLVIPGPGILFILAGTAVISPEFGKKLTSGLERYANWRKSWSKDKK